MLIMRRVIRGLGFGVLFVGVLMCGGVVLHRSDPFREVPIIREKWDHWLEHKDEYDTLFIGTSRTYRGISPAQFDEATAAAGMPTHSFNFGIDAMLPPEDAYVSEFVLRHPSKNLKWVFIELGVFVDDFEDRDPDSIRSRHWHDWRRASLCVQATLWPKQKSEKWRTWFRPRKDKPWPADTAWTHLRLLGARSLNFGRGAAALNEWMAKTGPNPLYLGPQGDGFNPYPKSNVLKGDALAAYEKSLAERQKDPARPSPLKLQHQQSFDDVVNLVRKIGAKPIALIAPSTGSLRLRPADSSKVPLIDACDVQAFPQFYTPDVRIDTAHLNIRGAEIFTRYLADRFIELARQNP
jgi:hypothetical protein